MKVKSESEVTQSCLTLHDPMDCSLPGSSIHGIFQVRVLEWGAIAFSNVYIREGSFEKEYLAAVHGLTPEAGSLRDLLWRDKARKMTFVVPEPGKDVQEALLDYRRLDAAEDLSLLRIRLHTGRTHQIRCQFAARGWPLAGERKYDTREDPWPLALWSCALGFTHPESGEIPCV